METAQVTEFVLSYLENGVDNPSDIQRALETDCNIIVGIDFITEIVNDTIGFADDFEPTYDIDEGFDPYENRYTEDC